MRMEQGAMNRLLPLSLAQQLLTDTGASVVPPIVSAVAASVTALTAICAALFAFQQVRLARSLRKEQAQPYVALFMEPSAATPHIIDLVVRNFGSTAARDIAFDFSPGLQRSSSDGSGPENVEFPSQIPTLVPGQEWRTMWDFGPTRVEQGLEGRHTVSVSYLGIDSHERLSFSYELDWSYFIGRRWVQTYGIHDAAKALREIEKNMRGWRESGNRGLKVYVRDGDQRDEQLAQQRAQAIIDHERFMNEIRHTGDEA